MELLVVVLLHLMESIDSLVGKYPLLQDLFPNEGLLFLVFSEGACLFTDVYRQLLDESILSRDLLLKYGPQALLSL
jgi:hypothetical protein